MKHIISMSEKELRAIQVIHESLKGKLTTKEAANRLERSERTVYRMKEKVKRSGAKALAHRSRGKQGHHQIPEGERKKIERLLKETFFDFTPAFATEKLREEYGIVRDRKTIASIMRTLSLITQKKQRTIPVIHRAWREPKVHLGELVQFDGSYEAWLEDRFDAPGGGHEICLLAAIDDATGRIMRAEFAKHEGVLPVMGFWGRYAMQHGLPVGIYLDKFSTYKMHLAIAAENPDTLTQFARAMRSLDVTLHFANSPQAKGRVERLFRTLQDRLVKELRLQGINDPEAANRFLATRFIRDFNRRFSRKAHASGDRHRVLRTPQRTYVNEVFSRHDVRTLRNDFTITHGTCWYQLEPTPGLALRPKELVEVRTYPDARINIFMRGKQVNWKPLTQHPVSQRHFRVKNGVIRIPTLAMPIVR